MTIDIAQLKEKLIAEKALLERELASVGRVNPDNPNDWESTAADLNTDQAEVEERAAEISDFRDRTAVEFELESRFRSVERALENIAEGRFGKCVVCKNEIEEARLLVNPSAETCKAHMETGSSAALV